MPSMMASCFLVKQGHQNLVGLLLIHSFDRAEEICRFEVIPSFLSRTSERPDAISAWRLVSKFLKSPIKWSRKLNITRWLLMFQLCSQVAKILAEGSLTSAIFLPRKTFFLIPDAPKELSASTVLADTFVLLEVEFLLLLTFLFSVVCEVPSRSA